MKHLMNTWVICVLANCSLCTGAENSQLMNDAIKLTEAHSDILKLENGQQYASITDFIQTFAEFSNQEKFNLNKALEESGIQNMLTIEFLCNSEGLKLGIQRLNVLEKYIYESEIRNNKKALDFFSQAEALKFKNETMKKGFLEGLKKGKKEGDVHAKEYNLNLIATVAELRNFLTFLSGISSSYHCEDDVVIFDKDEDQERCLVYLSNLNKLEEEEALILKRTEDFHNSLNQ